MNEISQYLEEWDRQILFGDVSVLLALKIAAGLWLCFFIMKKIGASSRRAAQKKSMQQRVRPQRRTAQAAQAEIDPERQNVFKQRMLALVRSLSDFSDTEKTNMPSRVLEDIRKNQDFSEIYVAALQLLVIAVLSGVYLYSLRGGAEISLFNPIPSALALYAVFTVTRLVLALLKELGSRILMLSLMVDFFILAFVIFNLQSGGTQAAPLFYFFFVLIALRTLRFQPIWVFAAGALAIVSCVALGFLTRDALSGAQEAAMLLSLFAVTAILMLSQLMAKRISYEAARSQSAVSDLSHFFDQDVVRKIVAQEEAPDLTIAERRTATIMFIDLRGFTVLSRSQSAGKTISMIKDYQNLVVPIIRKHGGSIDKFMGDGILASFGAVKEMPNFASAALNAAQEIFEVFNQWRVNQSLVNAPAPNIGMGMASGDIIYGIIGDEVRYEYTVIGDAVNYAAKLEKHTKAQQVPILCDDTTAALAREQGSTIKLTCFKGVEIEGVPGYSIIWTIDLKKDSVRDDVYFQ